jgi:hypothetical protein
VVKVTRLGKPFWQLKAATERGLVGSAVQNLVGPEHHLSWCRKWQVVQKVSQEQAAQLGVMIPKLWQLTRLCHGGGQNLIH